MARLVLKLESQVLREIPVASGQMTIGRSPDNDIHVEDRAVSDHHARLHVEDLRIAVEDLGSSNGTFVNDIRISRAVLRDGDNIRIGQHVLQLDTVNEAASAVNDAVAFFRMPDASPEDEDPEDDREIRRQNAIAKATARPITPFVVDDADAPILRVQRGSTDQPEYRLLAKLTVIGKAEIASVRMLGWFDPAVGAQINHRRDGYYLGMGDVIPRLNGQPIDQSTLLRDGDIIEVGGTRLQFSLPAR